MATLTYADPQYREGWLRYAIEFGRRGLWPEAEIETHGPHAPPADLIWGQAEARLYLGRGGTLVEFSTPRGRLGYGDLRGLRVHGHSDAMDRPGEHYPVVPLSQLPPVLQKKIKGAKRELADRARSPGR